MCRECLDPFEEPECEALDVFVNEFLCIGKGAYGFILPFCSCFSTKQHMPWRLLLKYSREPILFDTKCERWNHEINFHGNKNSLHFY